MIAKPYAAVSALMVLGMFAVAAFIARYGVWDHAARVAKVGPLFLIPASAAA